jgi:exopolyphosphatase / guanosine-5'-triphosphate,3'-diphosphate pyrophosphatase
MKTQRLAAIDIGSNSIKLAIVEAAASDSFTILLQERERVRLGETLRQRFISPESIQKSADAIAKFRSISEARNVNSIIAVATASVREASNSQEFVNEVERQTGIRVDVLSSVEEARLIGISAVEFFRQNKDSLLNIDIGGGSTELSLMKDGLPEKLFSMKLGAVGLTEKFLLSNPPKPKEIREMQTEIELALERPLRELQGEKWQIASGTSGTIWKFANLVNSQTSSNVLTRPEINLKKLIAMNQILAKMTTEKRAELPILSVQRAEVIVAGGQILESVMRALKIETLLPCGYALREGVIIDHLREIETESLPPVPDVLDLKLRGVFAIGRRYGYEERHALQVAFLAETIFDSLAKIYKLERHHRTLLSAAAILHDIGYHISHDSHHKHSSYLIKNSEITGFSENEKNIIAQVARYHRGSLPREKHVDFMSLVENDRNLIKKLGSILRIADALDRGYENRVSNIKFTKVRQVLTMELSSEENIDSEMKAIELKKEMFEQAFGCSLNIV